MSTETAPASPQGTGTPTPRPPASTPQTTTTGPAAPPPGAATPPREIGGPAGPEPTRYGDWEVRGRCSDF